jgi:hypothetical protein
MWEKINKVIIQNALALVIVVACFSLAFVAAWVKIPAENLALINKVIDMSLVGVIGWLFTQSKRQQS